LNIEGGWPKVSLRSENLRLNTPKQNDKRSRLCVVYSIAEEEVRVGPE